VKPVISLPSLREVVGIAFCFKWRILLAFMLPIAVSLGVAFSLRPQYLATSEVLVRAGREYMPQSDTPGESPMLPPQSTMQETINNEIAILTGQDLLSEIIHEQGISRLYPELAASPPTKRTLEDAAVGALRRDLVVTPVKLSNVIEISLRNPDRQVAVQALQLVLSRFQERHMAAFSAVFSRVRTAVLESQLTTSSQQLAALEQERAAYQNENGLFAISDQLLTLVQQKTRDEEALLTAKIERAGLSQQLSYLRAQLAQEPEKITVLASNQESPVAVEAQRRAQQLRQQEQELAVKYPHGSPLIAPARAALASAEAFASHAESRTSATTIGPNAIAAQLKNQLYSAGAALAPLESKIDLLEKAIAAETNSLAHLKNGETHLLDLNRRVEQLSQTTNTLRQRLVDARFREDLDHAPSASLKVIQQPSAVPDVTRKTLFLAAGMAVGMFLSGLMLLLAMTFGNRFLMVETVERVLAPPVVAALPGVALRRQRRIGSVSDSNDATAGGPLTI
jgi:uncharacterized protein involved in exopolysaccharide biosynthesis